MAAPSEVAICNTALILIGEERITSLGDANNRAIICSHLYDEVRDATLRAYPWNCAVRRADMGAPMTAEPEWGFTRQFQLPINPFALRVLTTSIDPTPWRVEGRRLLTDVDTLQIRYIARIVDVAQYDHLLRAALAARLAADIAYPLTKDGQLGQAMWALYERKLQEAYEIDTQEGTPEQLRSDALELVRGGGGPISELWR